MSSKIEVQRICQHCGIEFTARTTVTKCCSNKCAKASYKKRMRGNKIEQSNKEVRQIKSVDIEQLKLKEFLKVSDASKLLDCSVRTMYYLLAQNDSIKAVNLGERLTRIKRSDIDELFFLLYASRTKPQPEPKEYDISECYSTEEVREKYRVSESALRNIIIKYKIPKTRKGWYAYVPKVLIDKIFKDGN